MKGIVVAALAAMVPGAAFASWPAAKGHEIRYSTVTGYFLQDEPDTDPNGFDYTAQNFGLLNKTYPTDVKFDPEGTKTQWQRFAKWVKYLNHNCRKSDKVKYKVLVMGRHGEGYHNVAESYYGTPAWNASLSIYPCYWAELTGNGTSVWEDAKLTPDGTAQAEKANAYFKSRFEEAGMPYFESYYSSPLTRCVQTANTTFATLDLPAAHPFLPTIKENFREGISIHTCDHRGTKSHIHKLVPTWKFENGFTQEDELWTGTEGETSDHQIARSHVALDDVFSHDDATWISITSHSGEIGKLLSVMGHRSFSLSTGQIIPVLVKAEVVEPEPTTSYVGFTSEATCTAPPATSIAGQGCVCSESPTLASMATPTP